MAKHIGDDLYGQEPFPADWNQYGDKAGLVRNGVMMRAARVAKNAGQEVLVLALKIDTWSARHNRGTSNAIRWADHLMLPYRVEFVKRRVK